MPSVLQVLYLIFNEGYTASAGAELHRVDLTAEAIRLTRQLHARRFDDGEVTGLLALMLLTEARRPARVGAAGALVSLAEQDRSRWGHELVAEGISLVTSALRRTPAGPYQLQAAIAALHDEATTYEATDWRQILALYELLDRVAPGPMVTLNRIAALAMAQGPRVALMELTEARSDGALANHHRADAVQGHLLEMLGEREAARRCFENASRLTLSLPEQRYLIARARAVRV